MIDYKHLASRKPETTVLRDITIVVLMYVVLFIASAIPNLLS
jgi:hypothetical protein